MNNLTSFLESYMQMWNMFGNFRARTSRSTYWKTTAVNVLILLVLLIFNIASHVFLIIYFLYSIAAIIPGLAMGVRRLHDTNRSGGWMFIALIPVVGSIILLVFFLLPSDSSDNRYGPPALT